jgi:ABC-type multidrug transport system fused ATPase/permease subunit
MSWRGRGSGFESYVLAANRRRGGGGRHRGGARPDILRRALVPFGLRHGRVLGQGLFFTCLLVGTRLALPLPLTGIVERSSARSSPRALIAGWADPVALLAVGFVSLALMAGLAEHYQRLAFAHFAGRSVSDARAAALARIGQTSGDGPTDLAAEVIVDSARVKQGLKGLLNHIVLNCLLVLGACIALASVDTQLGVVLFAGAGTVVALAILGATRVAAVAAEHRHGEVLLSGVIPDLVSGGRGEPDIEELSDLRGLDLASAKADINMSRCEGRTTCAVHVVLTLTAAAVLAVGVGASDAGRLGNGSLFTVVAYLLLVYGPGVRLARQITRIGSLLVSAKRLGLVLLDPPGKNGGSV